jgi:hypothetical protein
LSTITTHDFEIRGGVENSGITEFGSDYGYEPNGMIHELS